MVTTITTTAVATATAAESAPLVALVIVTFLVLLIQKETVSGLAGPRAAWLSRALTVALVPLALVFLTALIMGLVSVLR
jgi:hypothetical protein